VLSVACTLAVQGYPPGYPQPLPFGHQVPAARRKVLDNPLLSDSFEDVCLCTNSCTRMKAAIGNSRVARFFGEGGASGSARSGDHDGTGKNIAQPPSVPAAQNITISPNGVDRDDKPSTVCRLS